MVIVASGRVKWYYTPIVLIVVDNVANTMKNDKNNGKAILWFNNKLISSCTADRGENSRTSKDSNSS